MHTSVQWRQLKASHLFICFIEFCLACFSPFVTLCSILSSIRWCVLRYIQREYRITLLIFLTDELWWSLLIFLLISHHRYRFAITSLSLSMCVRDIVNHIQYLPGSLIIWLHLISVHNLTVIFFCFLRTFLQCRWVPRCHWATQHPPLCPRCAHRMVAVAALPPHCPAHRDHLLLEHRSLLCPHLPPPCLHRFWGKHSDNVRQYALSWH